MDESTSDRDVRGASGRSGVVAAVHTAIHAMIWLACIVVAVGITRVTRGELIGGGLYCGPLTLRFLKLADAVEAPPPAALLGLALALALAAVDFAVVYALGGRSRRAEVARIVWSAAVTATPFVALALALIALDLPFRAFAMSKSNVLNQQLQVERGLEGRLIGTWRATSLQKVGEAASLPPGALTVTFSRVKGTFPDLRAESSDESVLLSGGSSVMYRGLVPYLYLGEGKQVCLAPRDPGDRMTLWVAPADARLEQGRLPDEVTVVVLERQTRP
jgi:hypothetical protein